MPSDGGITEVIAPDVERMWLLPKDAGFIALSFDATISESHSSELIVTDNPVETGVVVSDHAYMSPLHLEIEGAVTDTWLYATDATGAPVADEFEGVSRSRRAFEILQQVQSVAEPFTVVTGLRSYNNMVLTNLTAQQDKSTPSALFFKASLREVIIASTLVVTYPPRKEAKTQRQAAKTVDAGTKTPEEPKVPAETPKLKSILLEMTGLTKTEGEAISFDGTSPELRKMLGPGSGF